MKKTIQAMVYKNGMMREDAISLPVDLVSHSHFADHKIAVFPGFCDVHVHLREPGFSYKETILSGTKAAARRCGQPSRGSHC